MDKKRNIVLLVLFILLSTLIFGCGKNKTSDKDIVEYLKNIQSYTSDGEIIVKNDRQEIKYNIKQVYDQKMGYKLDINDERSNIYIAEKIYVFDKIANKKYKVGNEFDEFLYMTFINEYVKMLYTNPEIKCKKMDMDNRVYYQLELDIPKINKNMSKAFLYIDMETLLPWKMLIYTDKNEEAVIVNYKNFVINEVIDPNNFKME